MRKHLFIPLLLLLIFIFFLLRLLESGEFAAGTSLDRWRVESPEQARSALLQKEPRPITVNIGKEKTRLPAEDLQINWKATLRQIPRATLWQKILGSGGRSYSVRWRFSRRDLRQLWRRSLQKERDPSSPTWQWREGAWKMTKGGPGLRIDKKSLWQNILRTARLGGGDIRAEISRPPQKSRREVRRRLPTQLLLDQSEYTLFVYRQGKLLRTYPVAVGAPDSPTPNGNWTILERAEDPAWLPPDWAGEQAGILVPGGSPDNPIVSRWMGIGDGVGIHGTRDIASLGSAASKGCVRMDPSQVIELYQIVPQGTPFVIRS